MLKRLFLSVLTICLFPGLHAQFQTTKLSPEYKSYSWDETPKLHDLTKDEKKRNEVVIKDKRIIEYFFDSDDTLSMYITHHLIVRVNSDKAIEENNTAYVPLGEGVKVMEIKARAIAKDGKVTPLNDKNIKDVDNYENQGPFRIFAIDGIEAGGEVEYIYTVRRPVRIYSTEYIRRSALHKLVNVDIYSPKHLVFLAKSYNGFPDMVLDSTMDSKRHIFAKGYDIEGYDHEDFSADDGALMRMEYVIAYNKAKDPDTRLYSYSDFCQKLFDVLDKESDKQDIKTAEKVIDTMKMKNFTDEEKIRHIESVIKGTIAVRQDVSGDKSSTLPVIFKNHVCDETGILKVYHLLFNAANITHQIVMTSDRFDKPFDGDFDSWTYLQKYLIYFPTANNYIAPTEVGSRYGFMPAEWICQKGYFMHSVTIGKGVQTGVGVVRELPCNDYKKTTGEIYADVKFDLDLAVVNLHFKQTFSGYEAYSFQPFYNYLADQDRKDFTDKLFKSIFEDAKPTNVKVSGYNEKDIFRNPFVIEADFSTNSVLEKTGNKYLFKVGELIGPQSQLYHDSARHTPIENHYNHGYHREIKFTIPNGYKVTNLDAANMDVYDGAATDAHTMEFHSYYKTDGNTVTVYCDEYYAQLRYPISMYEQFRNVINASADFNKIVFFLEKK
ncbi:MAG TPA: hypothetical protein VN922_10950 [Bacteroidia bacterium]|nr:hypothetical protein [Bacteroidia bacterium]